MSAIQVNISLTPETIRQAGEILRMRGMNNRSEMLRSLINKEWFALKATHEHLKLDDIDMVQEPREPEIKTCVEDAKCQRR